MPQDDNAAASANARSGLGALGQFLYQNSVTKPAVQANTAAQLQQTQQADTTFKTATLPTLQLTGARAQRQNAQDVNDLYLKTRLPKDISVNNMVPGTPYDPDLPFGQQHPNVQNAMIERTIAERPSQDVPMSKEEASAALAQNEYGLGASVLPPVNIRTIQGLDPNLQIDKVTGGPQGISFEAAGGGVRQLLNPDGTPSGLVNARGNIVTDPNHLKPEDIEAAKSALNTTQAAQDQTQRIQDIINNNPDLVGPLTGSKAANAMRTAKASVGGNTQGLSNLNELNQFLAGQLFDSMSGVKVSRWTEAELGQLKQKMPLQTAPKDVWDAYFTRLNKALQRASEDQSELLRGQGVTPRPSLPPVGPYIPGQIIPPQTHRVGDSVQPGSSGGAGAAPASISSESEYNALPKGSKFIWTGGGPNNNRIGQK